MINIAQDSDGNTFQLWQQQQQSSCGVASAWMARGIVRQMSFAEDEWPLAARMFATVINPAAAGTVPSAPMTFDPRRFSRSAASMGSTFANRGTIANEVAAILRADGLNAQVKGSIGRRLPVIPHLIGDRRAAIAGVTWNGGGGHWVVAARQARNGRIVYLDPWTGRINEQPSDGTYVASYGSRGIVDELIYLS